MATDEARNERTELIARLLAELWQQGIRDKQVLRAVASVPRERFVPDVPSEQAWANQALPIASSQTISQPFVVALMTEALALTRTEHVLEIGTGSGYQTAILATLADRVTSIERHEKLAVSARGLLAELGCRNVAIHVGDGTGGWPASAPYDRIIVTAAAPQVPPPLLEQLAGDGGRMVIPVGEAQDQALLVVDRDGDEIREHHLGQVRFVPLIGRDGWAATIQHNGHHGI